MKKYTFFIAAYIILFSSCQDNNSDLALTKKTDEQGRPYYVLKNGKDSTLLLLGLFESGKIDYVINFIDDYEQIVSYHEESGVVMSKIKSKKNDGLFFDRAYYFYSESGDLDGIYNFKNGVKTGPAVNLYDTTGVMKMLMYYNDNGELYYREYFDKNGVKVKTEGSAPEVDSTINNE